MSAVIQLACWLTVQLVFAAAVIGKVRTRASWTAYQATFNEIQLLPKRWRAPSGRLVVAAEAGTTALLVLPETRAVGLVAACGLLTVFAMAVAVVVRRRLKASCPCFGVAGAVMGWQHVLRNIVLAGLAAASFVLPASEGLELPGMAVAVSAAVFLAITTIYFAELVEVLSPVRRPS